MCHVIAHCLLMEYFRIFHQSSFRFISKMKRRSGRHIFRRKNIYLPTEVWVDIFCYAWITRQLLAQMVDKIGNRWFAEQLQFYLHEWGKHTLGHLYFGPQGVSKWHNGQYQQLEYPQTAMPENIKFFKSLQIEHFENRVFNFIRRIQSLFTADTKLDIHYIREDEVDNARNILGHLLPFIDGIQTMFAVDWMLPVVQSFPTEKLHQIKVLDVHFTRFEQSDMQTTMEWLTSGNEPKLLLFFSVKDVVSQQVLETIRKQFIEATEPSTFAFVFRTHFEFPAFQCENAIGEQLCGIRKSAWVFQVFRHQANNAEAGDQLRKWVDGNMDKGGVSNRKQCIQIVKPTIGPGRIFALPDLDVDEADVKEEEEDEYDKPSTSKKRRICK